MTWLIIQVASRNDALSALAAGADGVEAVSPETVRPVAEAMAGRRPVGLALPSGTSSAAAVDQARGAIGEGADYVVVPLSLAGEDPVAACRRMAADVPPHMLHAAFGSDEPASASALAACAAAGFAGARLEAAGRRIFDSLPIMALQRFVRTCAAEGLASGLSGRLEAPDMPRLAELEPHALILACAENRRFLGEPGGLSRLRALVPNQHTFPADTAVASGATDRVFLHDLVLPVFVGAYHHEEQSRQRVRFAVDVDVARIRRSAHDMADIFSYDLILDAIRLLTASGHWVVIESLAERIAARLLRHPRAVRVAVRIEKLDVCPCVVGVEIVRMRGESVGHG